MNRAQAEALLGAFMRPTPFSTLFEAAGKHVWTATDGPKQHRAILLGPDPRQTVLNAFETHSANLEYHSPAPNAPPPPTQVAADQSDFLSLIRAYHQRGYTVRVPEVVPLSPALQAITRAIELLVQQPASAALFWSYAGAKAQIHYDNRDNLVVQLEGRKRWLISSAEPALYNDWLQLGAPPAELHQPQVVDVEPGDMIYIPRGTPHSVESTTESLHVAILFNPVTVRDMLIAAINNLSDSDRSFRETAFSPVDGPAMADLVAKLQNGSEKLLEHCQSQDFVRRTAEHRAARIVGEMPALRGRGTRAMVNAETKVRHAPMAIATIRTGPNAIGFSQPGGEFAVHPGVEPELRYISATPEFRVSDIPGHSGIDVRAALVQRLISSGFLEPVL